ncbi:MAG: hypothetical protein V4490_03060, partial [Pseudomonadota bacterium]
MINNADHAKKTHLMLAAVMNGVELAKQICRAYEDTKAIPFNQKVLYFLFRVKYLIGGTPPVNQSLENEALDERQRAPLPADNAATVEADYSKQLETARKKAVNAHPSNYSSAMACWEDYINDKFVHEDATTKAQLKKSSPNSSYTSVLTLLDVDTLYAIDNSFLSVVNTVCSLQHEEPNISLMFKTMGTPQVELLVSLTGTFSKIPDTLKDVPLLETLVRNMLKPILDLFASPHAIAAREAAVRPIEPMPTQSAVVALTETDLIHTYGKFVKVIEDGAGDATQTQEKLKFFLEQEENAPFKAALERIFGKDILSEIYKNPYVEWMKTQAEFLDADGFKEFTDSIKKMNLYFDNPEKPSKARRSKSIFLNGPIYSRADCDARMESWNKKVLTPIQLAFAGDRMAQKQFISILKDIDKEIFKFNGFHFPTYHKFKWLSWTAWTRTDGQWGSNWQYLAELLKNMTYCLKGFTRLQAHYANNLKRVRKCFIKLVQQEYGLTQYTSDAKSIAAAIVENATAPSPDFSGERPASAPVVPIRPVSMSSPMALPTPTAHSDSALLEEDTAIPNPATPPQSKPAMQALTSALGF